MGDLRHDHNRERQEPDEDAPCRTYPHRRNTHHHRALSIVRKARVDPWVSVMMRERHEHRAFVSDVRRMHDAHRHWHNDALRVQYEATGDPMTSVLITGGAGFIGSNLADSLLADGYEVHIVDNLSTGSAAKIPTGAIFHEIDIRDVARLNEITRTAAPATIFHLAAQADVRKAIENPGFDADVNIIGTVNVLEAAHACGARVVFSSTGGAAYGEYPGLTIPTPEKSEPRPMSHYGMSKMAGEGYCGLYHRLYGLEVVVLRLGNVYGPRQDPHGEAGVVAIFCARLLEGSAPKVFGDGLQTRDYVYVGDVVAAFRAAQTMGVGQTINIGWGHEVSVLDLLDGLGATVQPEFAPARAGELQRSALDNARAGEVLDWRPEMPLALGLRRTFASIAVTHADPSARPPGFLDVRED